MKGQDDAVKYLETYKDLIVKVCYIRQGKNRSVGFQRAKAQRSLCILNVQRAKRGLKVCYISQLKNRLVRFQWAKVQRSLCTLNVLIQIVNEH